MEIESFKAFLFVEFWFKWSCKNNFDFKIVNRAGCYALFLNDLLYVVCQTPLKEKAGKDWLFL